MKQAGCSDVVVLQSSFTPEANAQVSSTEMNIKEFHAQVEGIVLVCIPTLPPWLNAPHVVEDVQLGGQIRQKKPPTMLSNIKCVSAQISGCLRDYTDGTV